MQSNVTGLARGKILVVDDIPSNLKLLFRILETEGYSAIGTVNAQQALDILAKEREIDLILLDVMLPDMDGFELCHQLKTDPATEKIPIIFLSARTATADIVRGFDVGGSDYITKPFQVREVLSRVTVLLRQRRMEAELRQSREALQNLANELEDRVAERNRELIVANEQLRELDALKTEFISRISHELRTPLTNIKVYASLLDRGKPERWESYLATFNREIGVLQTLIEALLDMAFLDAGQIAAQLVVTDLDMLIQDLSMAFQDRFAARPLTLACDLPPDLPPVWANPSFLNRVMENLLINALNYATPSGTVTVRGGVAEDAGKPWVTVAVADTGPGISDHELTLIFDRFYRGAAAQDYTMPGLGLGLSVAKGIVKGLGGRITVQSQLGEGSVFTVWLPPALVSPKTESELDK
ncbi:MAG: hybrid sensor histidine kinase/response regulator [Caldilineaceae bacterium]|nr:hybrid sensor histidine kinase/response regulator [Caldilineaceae bacterium]MBP8125774.1 hybrid sensor histidine kinase/response regulator [Caldilineaceae bacterium]MBP9074730.1 hybrid sensor histidine kinase/response regulator [Caldilineaceae bacterium]